MQGRVIAKNLLERKEQPEVIVTDLKDPGNLPAGAKFVKSDVLNASAARSLVSKADAVVLAVPSSIAHQALANLIGAGKPVADVSFTPDPPLDLNDKAKKQEPLALSIAAWHQA